MQTSLSAQAAVSAAVVRGAAPSSSSAALLPLVASAALLSLLVSAAVLPLAPATCLRSSLVGLASSSTSQSAMSASLLAVKPRPPR